MLNSFYFLNTRGKRFDKCVLTFFNPYFSRISAHVPSSEVQNSPRMMTQTSNAEALDLHKSSQGEKTNIVQFFTMDKKCRKMAQYGTIFEIFLVIYLTNFFSNCDSRRWRRAASNHIIYVIFGLTFATTEWFGSRSFWGWHSRCSDNHYSG